MWKSVTTNAGKALFSQWVAGKTLNVASVASGEGVVQEEYLMAQTSLVAQKQTLSIIKTQQVEDGIRLQLQCTNTDLSAAYTINQIGVWAKLDDGEPVMVAIFQDDTGVGVPSHDEMPDYVFTFYAIIQVSNVEDITVNIDTSALVSQADLEQIVNKMKVLIYFDDDGYPTWERVDE